MSELSKQPQWKFKQIRRKRGKIMARKCPTSLSGPSWWKQSDLYCPSCCPRGCRPPLQTKTLPSHSPPDSTHWWRKRTKIWAQQVNIVHVLSLYFFPRSLTCQLQGRGPAASFPFGLGQSAANGSVCFWEQWTLGFFQKLHTYTLGWYTLRSGAGKQKEGKQVGVDRAVGKWRLQCTKKWDQSGTNLHLSGSSGKTWGRNYMTGKLQRTDPETQHNVLTETWKFKKKKGIIRHHQSKRNIQCVVEV